MSSVLKATSSVIRSDYDNCDSVLRRVQYVSFDLQELVNLVDEQSSRGLTTNQLYIPPLKLRQLCELTSSSQQQQQQQQQQASSAAAAAAGGAGGRNNNGNGNSTTAMMMKSLQAEQEARSGLGARAKTAGTFAQALWDRAVHLYRLTRHLGRPLHSLPVIEYRPGELARRLDQYNTELELLLLRSKSGKAGDDELCYQFVRGTCPRGASCSFSHSKGAVNSWASKWCSEHVRDYTHCIQILTSPNAFHHQNSGNSSDSKKPQLLPPSSSSKKRLNKTELEQKKLLEEHNPSLNKPFHPLQRGSMLRFAETVGPEAFSLVLDLLRQRDRHSQEISIGKESELFSLVIRHAMSRATFDVLCSGLEMCCFSSLQALDLNKCDLSSVGKHRMAKLGKTVKRCMLNPLRKIYYNNENNNNNNNNVENDQQQQQQKPSSLSKSSNNKNMAAFQRQVEAEENNNSNNNNQNNDNNDPNKKQPNKMIVSLGHNNLLNLLSAAFLQCFSSASLKTSSSTTTGDSSSSSGKRGVGKQQQQQNSLENDPLTLSSPVHKQQRSSAAAMENASFSSPYSTASPVSPSSSSSPINSLAFASSPAAVAAATVAANNAASTILHGPSNSSFTAVPSGSMLVAAAGATLLPSTSGTAITTASSASIQQQQSEFQQIQSSQAQYRQALVVAQTPLLSLNLEFNNIGPSQPDFAEFIASLNECLPHIEKLSLAGNPLLYDGATRLFPTLAQWCSVQVLDLSGTAIGDRGVSVLCDTLKSSSEKPLLLPLKTLNLGWNGLSYQSISALSDLLKFKHTELQVLKLDYNPSIGRRGAILLSQALKENNTLRRLDMRWCYIADEGALAILDALGQSRNYSLCVFNFDKQEVDARTAESLLEKLNPVLEFGHNRLEMEKLALDMVF